MAESEPIEYYSLYKTRMRQLEILTSRGATWQEAESEQALKLAFVRICITPLRRLFSW